MPDPSIRGAIFAEIVARLKLIPGLAEVELMPFNDPAGFPALHVFDSGHAIVETEAGTTRYQITPTIEGYVEAPGGADAFAQLNEIYAAVVAALIAEPPLGGWAETVDEGPMRTIVAPLAGVRRLCFALDIDIIFPTRRGDPSLAA